MHIVLLNDDFPLEGGNSVAHFTKVLAEQLRANDHRVTVVTTHRSDESKEVLTGENGTIVSLPVSYRKSLRHYLSLYNPRVSSTLSQVLKRLQPDVVHAHNIHQYLTYDALRVARQFTDKVFLTCHDVMSIAYGRLATGEYLASEGRAIRLSLMDHLRTAGLQYNPLRNWFIRRTIKRHVKKVVAVSQALQTALAANGISKLTVIHNGSNPDYWRADAAAIKTFREEKSLTERKTILFAGRLRRDKGIASLLQALAEVRQEIPQALLLVVGEANRWQGLVNEAMVAPNLSDHYQCLGWLSHTELAAAYGVADVVVTPSLCLDTFNLINLEAMANAKPVVGTCFGGTPEVIVDGVTGFIRNPLKTEEFAKAITTLLQDDELARKMGAAGQKRAREQFSLERMTESYLHLYQQ